MASDDAPSVLERLPGRSRLAWWLLAAIVIAVLLAALGSYLGIVSFGVFLYYVGRPVARRLEETVGTTTRAAALTILLGILPFVALLLSIVAIAIGQLLALTDADVARLLEVAAPGFGLDRVPESPGELVTMLVDRLRPADAPALLDVGTGAIALIAGLVFVVTLLFAFVYLLLRYDRAVAGWIRDLGVGAETPGGAFLRDVDRELSRIYAGQMLTVVAVVVLAWVAFRLLNAVAPAGLAIPFPILIAIVIGIASFVPLVGRSLVYIPLVAYLAVLALQTGPQLLWFPAAVAAVGWLVIDPIVRYGLRPYLSSYGTPSSVMLVGYLVGGAVFGWYGVFLAPIVVVTARRFLRSIFPALVHGEPIGGRRAEPSVSE